MHPLEKKVKAFCREIGLEEIMSAPGARALAAVSGGVDSMVMLTILHRLGYALDVATCNFCLRPEASHEVVMVKAYCDQLGVPFYTRRFQMGYPPIRGGGSMQMRARYARYNWFSRMRHDAIQPRVAVLTAHHRDDEVETILLNLFKYKHVELIQGIEPHHESRRVLRPMLSASKEEIREYAHSQGIPFAEDASNTDEKYLRNLIRHKLLPVLQEINPDVAEHVIQMKERQAITFPGAKALLDRVKPYCQSLQAYPTLIRIELLKDHPDDWRAMLHSLFSDESYESRMAICDLMSDQPGKIHRSGSTIYTRVHEGLLLERQSLTLSAAWGDTWEGEMPLDLSFYPTFFRVEEVGDLRGIDFHQPRMHYLDYDKIHFPVRVRLWQAGDRMKPLGLKGNKKISDILVDLHVPVTQKHHWAVFEDQKQIICLPGFRISEAVKLDEGTRRVVKLTVKEYSA